MQDLTIKAIMSVAMSINENSGYGAECLQKLKRVNQRARDPKVTANDLEFMAKEMIRNDINKQREEWADKWFYYGYDPGPSAGMAAGIETELWGLWILNERLKVVSESGVHDPLEDAGAASLDVVYGATFGRHGVPEDVLVRLAEFGVVEARTKLQQLRAIAASGVKEQQDAARKRKEDKEDEEAAAAYREAMKNAEGAEDPARARRRDAPKIRG